MPPKFGLPCALVVLAAAASGCGPSADDPLPPETDLYAYSLAVMDRARLRVPSQAARARYLEGRVHERFGFDEKALEIYAEVVKENPDHADAHERMGYILSQKKDRMQQAIEAYQNVIRARPGSPGVYSRLGLVFTHLGRLEDAHQALDEEIRAGSADGETYYLKGQVYALEGKHAEAVESFRRTLSMAPAHRMATYGLAQSLRSLGKAEEEKQALARFQEIKRKEDAETARAAARGESAGREKRRFAAETWIDAGEICLIAASAATDPGVRSDLMGHFLHAVEAAIRLDAENVEARQLLTAHHRRSGDLERAVRSTEEALRAIPNDPDLAQSAYELAGNLLDAEKTASVRLDLAYRLLSAATESMPAYPDAQREIARLILFRLEKPELLGKAVEHARKAVEHAPDPANYDVLAYALFRTGRPQDAQGVLEEGIRRHPGDETLRDRLQRLQESRGAPSQGGAPPANAGGGASPQ